MGGRPLVAWSLDAMRAAESVSVVVIAAPPGHERELERLAGVAAGRPGERDSFHPIVVTGGVTRAASVGHALAEVPAEAGVIVVHDAARPLTTGPLVDSLVARLGAEPDASGVIAATPISDTVKRVTDGRSIAATERRHTLWAAQTPQVFRAPSLRNAHEGEPARLAAATDDAMLVEQNGGLVLVEATPGPNPKITYEADVQLAELLLLSAAAGPRSASR